MSNPLRFLLITIVCWQYAASRHISQYPSFYGYSPLNRGQFLQPYQTPWYLPSGSYLYQPKSIDAHFPCGGMPVFVYYNKHCPNQYVGIMPHTDKQQYYYVCKPDCVILGKCQHSQIFNAATGKCVQQRPPGYIPTCAELGLFPVFSNYHQYFKCEKDLQPKVYSCPASMVFSPATKQCINSYQSTHTQLPSQSLYVPNAFPPCVEEGIFRSPANCSLYYKCDLNADEGYIQTRLQCSQGKHYDLQNNKCLPAEEVSCEMLYPNLSNVLLQETENPVPMKEYQYPVEQLVGEIRSNPDVGEIMTGESFKSEVSTNPTPLESEDMMAEVLSDSMDIGDQNNKPQRDDSDIHKTTIISEDTTSVEGSGFESASEETIASSVESEFTTISDLGKKETKSTLAYTTEMEEVRGTPTANDNDSEITEGPDNLTEELENTSSDIHLTTKEDEIKTHINKEEETTTVRVSTPFEQSKSCKDIDAHTNDISQTQIKNCFHENTTLNSNTDSEPTQVTIFSENTRTPRSTLHEQDSITNITNTTPTQSSVTELTPTTTDILETTKFPNETASDSEKDNLAPNIEESKINLESAANSQSSEKTSTEEIAKSPVAVTEIPASSSLIDDNETSLTFSNETTNKLIVETTASAQTRNTDVEPETTEKSDDATTQSNPESSTTRGISIHTTSNQSSDTTTENMPLTFKETGSTDWPDQTDDLSSDDSDEDYYDDFTTILTNTETNIFLTTTEQPAQTIPSSTKASPDKSTPDTMATTSATDYFTTSNENTNTTAQSTTTTQAEENLRSENSSEDSKVVTLDNSKEVSNNEITSAETIQTTSHSKRQFSHTSSTYFTRIQSSTSTPQYTATKTTSETCEKQSEHKRKEDPEQPSLDSVLRRTSPINKPNYRNYPRLEITADCPLHLHIFMCPTTCNKDHKHTVSTANSHAVLLKWFPNISNQTIGFENAKDINADKDKTQ